MRKLLNVSCAYAVTCIFSLFLLISCAVDDRYDVSNKIDTTIGIGKGMSLPIGHSRHIKITEFIDTTGVPALEMDDDGNYHIKSCSKFNSNGFELDETTLDLTFKDTVYFYNFKVDALGDGNYDIVDYKYPYIVHDTINNVIDVELDQNDIPKDVIAVRKLMLKKPVDLLMTMTVDGYSSKDATYLKNTGKFLLKGDESDDFIVEMPEYFVFEDNGYVDNNRLKIKGYVEYKKDINALYYENTFKVNAIDFSKTPKGFVEVVDGRMILDDTAKISGVLLSDVVYFDTQEISALEDIRVRTNLYFQDNLDLDSVIGLFNPDIETFTETIDLNLDEDVEVLKNAYIDITDPRLYLTINNGVEAAILTNATIKGYDKWGNEMADSRVDIVGIEANANTTTNVMIDRYSNKKEGWNSFMQPDLNKLISSLPDKINIDFKASVDNRRYAKLPFGKPMPINGDFEFSAPLAFDSIRLEYTYTLDSLFTASNPNSETSGNLVKDIRDATLVFTVLNTIPVGFDPIINMYDKDGNIINNAIIKVDGEIKRGAGTANEENMEAPAMSTIKVAITTQGESIKNLDRVDIKLLGSGAGTFNAKEYLQFTDISLKVDDCIVLEL